VDSGEQVSVRFFLPDPALRAAISTFYVLRIGGSEPVEDLIHPEWPNLRFLLQGDWELDFGGGRKAVGTAPSALVSGTLSKAARARGSPGVLVGAGLLPAGWARLTQRPAVDYVDTLAPLAELVGPPAQDVIARLAPLSRDEDICAVLDGWFRDVMDIDAPTETLLIEAHKALVDPEVGSVAEWAERLGRSSRQLERLSIDFFGMSPKRLLRRQRFLRTFATIRDQPLGGWGRMLDEHYVDQSQFIREFEHFIGMSPRAYFRRP